MQVSPVPACEECPRSACLPFFPRRRIRKRFFQCFSPAMLSKQRDIVRGCDRFGVEVNSTLTKSEIKNRICQSEDYNEESVKKIAEIVAKEPLEKSDDYPHIKNLLLARFQLTPIALRDRFESHQRRPGAMWADLVFELRSYLDNWLAGMKEGDFAELKELLVTEQIKKKAPSELVDHFLDSDVEEFVKTCDSCQRVGKPRDKAKSTPEISADYFGEIEQSDYTSPLILVESPIKDPRPCVDYRRLNEITRAEFFPLPNMEEIVENTIASPLTDALKGKIKKEKITWDEKCGKAFEELKAKLVTQPILFAPDFATEFILQTDAMLFEGDARNRWRDGPVCPAVDKELWRLGPDGSCVFWRVMRQ
ncbi:uncharacterized protein TNCV_794041 [Trichonephila clavipes]|nr:uncharacterized protein TNCV_794041 [Trichonephila clavipes]